MPKLNKRLSNKAKEVKSEVRGVKVYSDPTPDKRWSSAVNARAVQNEDGNYDISFSSETPVRNWGDIEVLSHENGDADFSRFMEVGAVLRNHDCNQIMGKPIKSWIGTDRKGRGTFKFGTTEMAMNGQREVDDETLRGVSAGFIVDQWMYFAEDGEYKGRSFAAGTWLATSWSLLEASLTPVPADPSVGVNRTIDSTKIVTSQNNNEGESEMKRKIKLNRDCEYGKAGDIVEIEMTDDKFRAIVEGDSAIGAEVIPAADPVVPAVRKIADPAPVAPIDVENRVQAELKKERARRTEINALGKRMGVDVGSINDQGFGIDEAKDYVLGIVEERSQNPVVTKVEVTRDGAVSFRDAAVHSILLRSGSDQASTMSKAGGESMAGWNLMRLLEDCMKRANVACTGNKYDMLARGFESGPAASFMTRADETISVTTSDFPYILANVMNKEMLAGAALAETTFRKWCKIGSVSDFKQASRLKLSAAGKLELVLEGAGYNMTKFAEQREVFQMLTYGKLFNLSRQAIINDDLDAFTGIPRSMGMVAAVLPNDLAVIALMANGNMADGNALFSTAHANVTDDDTHEFSTVDKARNGIGNLSTKMMQQTAFQNADVAAGESLKLRANLGVILAPPTGWQNPASVLATSSFGAGVEGANPLKGIAELVIEPSLEDTNFTGYSSLYYYGFANPAIAPVMEVAFLDGNTSPFMEETVNTGSAADGRTFKVRMDAVAKTVDWRGAQKELATTTV